MRRAIRRVLRLVGLRRPDPLAAEQRRIDRIRDPQLLADLAATGPFYGGMGAIEKAKADIATHGRRYLAMVDLLDTLDVGEGPLEILEIGCNTGFLSRFIKNRHPAHRVIAIDRSHEQIRANQLIDRVYRHPVEYRTLEGESLTAELGAGRFDVVYLCEILEHLEHRSAAQHGVLREALAAVKDSGVVVITVPYEDRIPSPGHLTEFTREMLLDLVGGEAAHVADLDAARTAFGLERHFIVLAARSPIAANVYAG